MSKIPESFCADTDAFALVANQSKTGKDKEDKNKLLNRGVAQIGKSMTTLSEVEEKTINGYPTTNRGVEKDKV